LSDDVRDCMHVVCIPPPLCEVWDCIARFTGRRSNIRILGKSKLHPTLHNQAQANLRPGQPYQTAKLNNHATSFTHVLEMNRCASAHAAKVSQRGAEYPCMLKSSPLDKRPDEDKVDARFQLSSSTKKARCQLLYCIRLQPYVLQQC
jgi:hypothetical protein